MDYAMRLIALPATRCTSLVVVHASLVQAAGLYTVVFLPCKGGVLELGFTTSVRVTPEALCAIESALTITPMAWWQQRRLWRARGSSAMTSPTIGLCRRSRSATNSFLKVPVVIGIFHYKENSGFVTLYKKCRLRLNPD